MAESWFETLFGFPESTYEETRRRFEVDGDRLRSLGNGRSFAIGTFSTPTLAELREEGRRLARPGTLRLTHEVIGDVLLQHAKPENAGALFQVASQFNCLEFIGPSVVSEDGVTRYAGDPTQGPACSLAAAAATVYRNYFAPVGDRVGQTRERQIDNLDELARLLAPAERFWEVRNGYTFSTTEKLRALRDVLGEHDREELLGTVKVGFHRHVGVTFRDRFTPTTGEPIVSQLFCSALSCGYSRIPIDEWEPLATLVLDAAYEATLWAGVVNAAETGNDRVWLTLLGGGAFGNRPEWIEAAIARASGALGGVALDVRVGHYGSIPRSFASN